MPDRPYDDPELEEEWVLSMRRKVEDYLRNQNLDHGEIGEWPAWHVMPITSIWAIESKKSPGWVGWWAIGGDHPTDYISSAQTRHPRGALRAFCAQWNEIAQYMNRGVPHPTIKLGDPSNWDELAKIMETHIRTFEKWAADDEVWDYDESEFEER